MLRSRRIGAVLQGVEQDGAESGPPMPKIEAVIAPQISQAMRGHRLGEVFASAIEIVGAEHRVARQEVAAAQARELLIFCSCGGEKRPHDGPPSAHGREMKFLPLS